MAKFSDYEAVCFTGTLNYRNKIGLNKEVCNALVALSLSSTCFLPTANM